MRAYEKAFHGRDDDHGRVRDDIRVHDRGHGRDNGCDDVYVTKMNTPT